MIEEKIPLSVAIITKNEEDKLPDCLKSVSFADDIVVVDSGSTDKTVEIARSFGCRVFIEDWKGYGPQKNSAVQKCKNEWALILDADERIPEETKDVIAEIIGNTNSADAYSFPRKNFFHGKWIKHGGWWPDEVIRLFRKDRGKISNRNVHEAVEVNGATKRLQTPILHYPIKNIEEILKKINSYSSLGAKDLHQTGQTSSIIKATTHSLSAFVKTYFLKQGFRDGKEGLIIAFSGAVNTFYKYVKLMELNNPVRKDRVF